MFRSCFGGVVEEVKGRALEVSVPLVHKGNGETAEQLDPGKKHFLLEIVGAIGLSFIKEEIDSFCTIKLGGKEIHRTKYISKT